MLKGRESLIRLIGKRRRLSRDEFLSTAAPTEGWHTQRCPELVGDQKRDSELKKGCDNGDGCELVELKEAVAESSASSFSSPGWANCPVCGSRVRGGDLEMNLHIDPCLAKGKKRKLTQSTLFHIKFSSTYKVDALDSSRNSAGTVNNVTSSLDFVGSSSGFLNACDSEIPACDSDSSTIKDGASRVNVSSQNQRIGDASDSKVDTWFSSEDHVPNRDTTSGTPETYQEGFETVIVGRRYSVEKEIDVGMSITLLRDPNNAIDGNAIKVSSADPGCSKVFGYIPKELSEFLSPLMEKFTLSFTGCITSVPKSSLSAVPIRIHRQSLQALGTHDKRVYQSLWTNLIHEVELAKTNQSGKIKYQENFCVLIKEVLHDNCHLLSDDERSFLESFWTLSDESQKLFIRLYMRKGPWFRLGNISYVEILNTEEAAKELSERGYVRLSTNELYPDDLKELLNCLTIPDLRLVAGTIDKKKNPGFKKQEILSYLLSSYEGGLCPRLEDVLTKKIGSFIRVSPMAESLFWRAERLFFLNGEHDLATFLLVDLGIVKYPAYNCITSEKIFKSRNDMLGYEEAIAVAQLMDQSVEENDSESVAQCITLSDSRLICSSARTDHSSSSSAPFLSSFSASWVYSKVVFLGISFLEKERRYKDAIALLRRLLNVFTCDSRRGFWTLRLSVDLEHINRPDESLTVAEEGVKDPWVRAGSKLALQRRILRLGKPPRRWKIPSFSQSLKRKISEVHVQGRPLNCEMGIKNRFYGEDGEQCGVEELALQYYAGPEGGEWKGVHSESSIWLTIFGLVMWDIIFSDVPNVFRSRFQTAPLDLDTDSFYLSRRDKIESQLEKIQAGMAEEILIASWQSNEGTSCKGVSWDRHSLSDLRAVVTCIGGSCLAALCRHLAQDYRSWSSGMPDLLLWRFHREYAGEAKLVEVKGPKDRLSEQQHAWLLFLMDCGFNTEVCKVNHKDSRSYS